MSRLTDASRQYRDSYCLKAGLSRLTDAKGIGDRCKLLVINISIYRGNNSSISRKYTKVFSNAWRLTRLCKLL